MGQSSHMQEKRWREKEREREQKQNDENETENKVRETNGLSKCKSKKEKIR